MAGGILETIYYLFVAVFNFAVEIYHHRLRTPKSDVTGQVFVITGGNAGIGKDIARQIALMNPKKVYITSRSVERGNKALAELRTATGKNNLELLILDLNSFASVKKAAEELKSKEDKINVLVLNAGLGFTQTLSRTQDGFDEMYQSNHLGHHLFFELLLPNIQAAGTADRPSRVVLTSSTMHYLATEDTLAAMETNGQGTPQYSATKLMNLLMVRYYSKRLGPQVVIHGVHPGAVASDFIDKFPESYRKFSKPVISFLFRTVEAGAATNVFVATHPSAGKTTGKYWSNNSIFPPHRIATDDKVAEKFMNISFDEIKIKPKN